MVAEPHTSAEASGWLNALQKIHDRAVEEQASQLAGAAVAVMESLSPAAQTSDASPADLLQNGVVKLQQILEGAPVEQARESEMSLAQDPELMRDFILESREHLVAIEAQLLTLEHRLLAAIHNSSPIPES